MPAYDYECAHCGTFQVVRPMDSRDDLCVCPSCGAEATRVLLVFPGLALMSASKRTAYSTNERSQNSPRKSHQDQGSGRHPIGCHCCSNTRAESAEKSSNLLKGFSNKRPWMISH